MTTTDARHMKSLQPEYRAMQRCFRQRDRVADLIRERLPWASVVSGAPRYPFISIDRGETIVGSSGFDDDGNPIRSGSSVWSRPVIGSLRIRWNMGEPCCLWREIDKKWHNGRRLMGCEELVQTIPVVGFNLTTAHWVSQAADDLVNAAEEHLTPIAPDDIAAQLKTGERFEHRIHGGAS